MSIAAVDLIDEFGRAAEMGNAAVFVGAGLSQGVGMPGWRELLQGPADLARVPLGEDLALSAEYLTLSGQVAREQLDDHILRMLVEARAIPGAAHRFLDRLPVDQIWTTNYDTLIEDACAGSKVVVDDDDVTKVGSARRSVVKIHGSLSDAGWVRPPIITRRDYETYQQTHPRMWALLRATYLSRTMLFLGFSFADPNIGVLLQLARTLGTSVGDRHMTVMARPDASKQDDCRLHDLRVRDLEDSGVRVHEIDDYPKLDQLLESLVRRTRPKRLFLSGSFEAASTSGELAVCRAIGGQLAARADWTLVSLGGPAGWHVSQQVGQHRRAEGRYGAAQFEFHFRKGSTPPERMAERLGMAIYHDREREELVPWLLDECRAMLVVGGSAKTLDELRWAQDAGVGIIPLANAGGAGREFWDQMRDHPLPLGGQGTSPSTWDRLGHEHAEVAARAALELLDQAMYRRSTA